MHNPPPFTWGDTTSLNPFTYLPSTMCDGWALPAIAECQDGTAYRQRRSEIAGLLMLPTGAAGPGSWTNPTDWLTVIDNAETDDSKAKYLVGIGSFLPDSLVEVSLSGGRFVENRERTYRLNMAVLNIDDGHTDICRKWQTNARRFSFWLVTVDGRIIGGTEGMRPLRVNADFVLSSGRDSREVWNITFTTSFLQYPATSGQAVDFDLTLPDGGGGGECGCDIQTLLADLPTYVDDTAALAGGLVAGEWYIVASGNDAYQIDLIKRVGA